MLKDSETWQPVRGLVGGLNLFDDPTNVGDTEIVSVKNMVYDGGFIQTRPGSQKVIDAPDGAGDALQTMVAHTSDGIDYLIGVYENKFYLYHDENEEWVQINLAYVPSQTDKRYGYVSWNNGRGDDRLYFCNGIDDFGKWMIAVDTIGADASPAATSIVLNDSTRFPTTGSVVIKDSSGVDFNAAFTANSGNTLTLSAPLGHSIVAGASIAMSVQDMPDMELGKVVAKWESRLMVANYYGGETVMWYSVLSDPEDFTPGTSVESAGSEVIADGNGGITGLDDFGAFLVIEKEDSFHTFSFQLSSDLGSKQSQITPIVSGQSVGPMDHGTVVRTLNTLIYPTRTEGFLSVYPSSTGGQVSITPKVTSQKIQPLVTKGLGYNSCRGVVFDQKALWAVSLKGAEQNILVLVYDTIRQAWSTITTWSVQDWAYKSDKLFYMDTSSGAIFQAYTGSFTDDNNPFLAEFFTKRFDFGAIAQPKTEDLVYIQGYLTSASKLYVDVLLNENGKLNKQTYLISKDTKGILYSEPISSMLGDFISGDLPLGWVILSQIGDVSFFRIYLGVNISMGAYNIQLRFYAADGSFYGITGVAFNPEVSLVVPSEMVASPILV